MRHATAFGSKLIHKENDQYNTPEWAVDEILKRVKLSEPVLEPCSGDLNIVRCLNKDGYKNIITNDIDTSKQAKHHWDFLSGKLRVSGARSVITNPPFSVNYNAEFIQEALECIRPNGLVVMLLKLTYYESKKRFEFFKKNPPLSIYVHHKRLSFDGGVGICYAWFVWRKGYKGKTTIELI